MSNLSQIVNRHLRDHWKDALFIAGAVLLLAISIGSVTSKNAKEADKEWRVETVQGNVEVVR
jgi:apolipoprotein N-acyltransferase